MKKVFAALAVIVLSMALVSAAAAAPLESIVGQKVTIPGVGDYSWREVFMDITVGSVSYALPDFSSFALSSPTLAKGAAQAYFQNQRTIAYRNYERAMENGSVADQRYYEGVIARLEAAVVWVSTGNGNDLRALLSKRGSETAEKEDAGPPSTVSADGKITATGPFTKGVPGVPYRDRYVTLTMGLGQDGIPVCYGVGFIKVSKGSDWIDYFFTLKPGRPLAPGTAHAYSSFPGSFSWEGNGTLEIRSGQMSWKGPIYWRAEMKNGTVTGYITDFFIPLSNKVPFDFLLAAIPEPLPFEAHFFDPSSGSGRIPFLERGEDKS